MRFFFLMGMLVSLTSLATPESGIIRGTVIEDSNGEPLFGVTVQIKGTTKGAITDFDGKFEIQTEPGTYDLQVSFVSFETITISGLNVQEGEVTLIDQIRLKEDIGVLEEVVVTAEVVRTTESALMTVKRKSVNLMDGISAASFKKIGDSDAGSAAKRVTGVSVEGGKYVYVRGLGDRYTKTMLNGVDIPGLDPDRNSLQIDIFPTNLLNNIVVLKSATADLPADFTGGLINIETKDFPDEKIFNVSVGVSYNPSMHFQSNTPYYKGSTTDWLGFDSGLRELPQAVDNRDLPQPFFNDSDEVYQTSKLFNPTLEISRKTNLMNYNLGVSYGDQKKLNNGHTLGYIFSTTYRRTNEFYKGVRYGEYQKRNETDRFDFGTAITRDGEYATESILLGGLAGVAYKTNTAKYRLSVLRLQNGESKAGYFDVVSDPEDDDFDPRLTSNYIGFTNNLEYSQKSLTNILLGGEHHLGDDKGWEIDWRVSPTISKITDPDIRRAAFTTESGRNQINAGAAGSPVRLWRFLDETNYVAKVDVSRESFLFGREMKYKFGSSYVAKDRNYSIQSFTVSQLGTTTWNDDQSFNDIIADENLFPNGNNIYYNRGLVNPNPNAYQSSNTNLAAYFSVEAALTEKLKSIVGVRMEKFQQRHTGQDQEAARAINSAMVNGRDVATVKQQIKEGLVSGQLLDNDKVLDATDFFPSANLIYTLTDKQNIRLSYSKTIARPSFKELSFAQILDPVSSRTFNGGLFSYVDDQGTTVWDGNLKETRINNFDLRWELFPGRPGELFSVSAFYKSFDSPIELVRITTSQSGREFQPRNVGNGQVVGAEFELRKSLEFLHASLSNFSVNGNLTLVESQIDMTSIEFDSRKVYEKNGENLKNRRNMAGQAPYVINVGLQYSDPEKLFDAGLFYNVKGETLAVVGQGFFPDVYQQPFHSLNFNLNKTLDAKEKASISVSISNILNATNQQVYSAYNSTDEVFSRLKPGVQIGLGMKYSF